MVKKAPKRLYLVPILSKALDILELMQGEKEPISLEAIYQQTRISKTTVYRILKTFVHRGYLAQTQNGLYRLVSRPKKILFGFAAQSSEMPFSEAVRASLQSAASAAGVDLLVLDNRYDTETALRNADELVGQHVDLAIEFQTDQQVAPILADKISGAGIPLIAVEMPHPHSTYFGVDNYRVGFEAGEILAQHAITQWKSQVDWVIGLELEEAGPLVQSRITGAFEAVRKQLPEIPVECFVRLDARGLREKSYKIVLDFLRRHPKDRHILVASTNDTVALGALQAARELKREKDLAIVGQDCIPEALSEIAAPRSCFIGSISHEVEKYGPELISLGLAILRGQTVAPYNYAYHRSVTRESLQQEG
ncbi:MAG TPA: substrate-binding domain-containing protein [Acidisarcina sp.]|nr:substrate-binding domain-containing protein [Acidisarcina sp.]